MEIEIDIINKCELLNFVQKSIEFKTFGNLKFLDRISNKKLPKILQC